jgi:hypothetical protein
MTNIDATGVRPETGMEENYLDHFKYCSVNTAAPKDNTVLGANCMADYGGPIDARIVLGGFLNSSEFPIMATPDLN